MFGLMAGARNRFSEVQVYKAKLRGKKSSEKIRKKTRDKWLEQWNLRYHIECEKK